MAVNLRILLIVVSIILLLIVLNLVSKDKLTIKYSLIWVFVALLMLVLGAFPNFIGFFTRKIGFETTSNLVIGIILTLLLLVTLILTIIISDQKRRIKLLIQEVSILKSQFDNKVQK